MLFKATHTSFEIVIVHLHSFNNKGTEEDSNFVTDLLLDRILLKYQY